MMAINSQKKILMERQLYIFQGNPERTDILHPNIALKVVIAPKTLQHFVNKSFAANLFDISFE